MPARDWWLRLTAAVGFVGVGFPRLRHPAQHGRLAQLVARTCSTVRRCRRRRALPALAIAGLAALELDRGRSAMSERYPGYDVLAKRHTPSWNEKTRRVIDAAARLAARAAFPHGDEWQTLEAICDRIVPQPRTRPPVPLAAMVDAKAARGSRRRLSRRTACRRCARRGARGLARDRRRGPAPTWRRAFTRSMPASRTPLLARGAAGRRSTSAAWGGMPRDLLRQAGAARHRHRLLRASDRLERDRLWRPGEPARLCADGFRPARPVGSGRGRARPRGRGRPGKCPCRMIRNSAPRGKDGRAPDVFRVGGWVPMREYRDDEAVDFAIVGTGAGGGTLACRLAEAGFSVVALRCRPVLAAARGFRLGRSAPAEALLDRRAHRATATTRSSSAPTTAANRSAAAPYISRWCRCASGPNGSSRAASSAMAPTGRSIGARCGTTTARSNRR